jgi:hypothetical protein
MSRPSKSATRLRYDDDTRYQTLAIIQFIELIAIVFTYGLKYRNKYEIVATPYFCLPTGLLQSYQTPEYKWRHFVPPFILRIGTRIKI